MKKIVRTPLFNQGNTKYKEVGEPVLAPEPRTIINDALTLLWVEIGLLKEKQRSGIRLEGKELRNLLDLSETAAKLTKEQRELDKGFNPEDMSDEEYLEQLEAASEAMREKIKNKKEDSHGRETKNNKRDK